MPGRALTAGPQPHRLGSAVGQIEDGQAGMHQRRATFAIAPHAFTIGTTVAQGREPRGRVTGRALAKPSGDATHAEGPSA